MTSQFQSNNIKRRRSTVVKVGSVSVGGDHPIAVQSMTNTVTTDVEATVNQIGDIVKAGADLVRVSVPDKDSVAAFAKIRQRVSVPLIADVHFDFSIAVDLAQCGADCLRINPGNIGNDKKVAEVIAAAKDRDIPIRIGVNAGSLEKSIQRKYGEPNADALVESALRHVSILEKFNFENFKVSVKASDVLMTIAAYTKLAERIEQPLHLGITEAGSERNGAVKSAMGLGTLLMAGIGDTIRVSLAADPVQEVKVGWDILRGLHLRSRGVNIIACPSCSRQNFDVIRTVNELESRLEDITESVDLAVIGCYVNGPGESKMADIGVTGADPANLIYSSGKASHKVDNSTLVDELEKAVRDKLANQKKSVNLPAETGDSA